MKAAIYLRVSTEDQVEKFGLDVQRERCKAMAAVKGWDVLTTFADEGLSGALGVTKRPGLAALLELTESGSVDAVIVAALDRLGRETNMILNVAATLKNRGVELVSCRESLDTSTPAGQLVQTIFAGLAQLERDLITERTMGGIVASVRAGNVHIGGSNAPYGYDVGEVDGNRTLVVNEEEAAVVRLMFSRYTSGEETIHSLATYLTERGIPKPSKGKNHKAATKHRRWSIGTIASIFANEVYVGRWHYRKTKREKQPDGSSRVVPRPRSEWLTVEVPAIIDKATFQIAEERRAANRRQMSGRQKHHYTLSGMLTCGQCGDIGMTGITRHDQTKLLGDRQYQYYLCNRRHNRKRYGGQKCELPPVTVTELDATVWQWVSEILLTPGRLREEWEKYQQRSSVEAQPILGMIEANQSTIADLEEEKRRLVKAYAKGALSLDDIAAEKTDIERTIEQYRSAVVGLQAELKGNIPSEADFETIEEYAAELELGVDEASEDLEARHELYRLMRLEVRVTYEDGNHWADMRCVLGKKRLSTVSSTPSTTGAGRFPPAG